MLIKQDTIGPIPERSSRSGLPLSKVIPGHRAGMTPGQGLGLPQETGPDSPQMIETDQMITRELSRPRRSVLSPPLTQLKTGRVEIPTRAPIEALRGQIPLGEFIPSCKRD